MNKQKISNIHDNWGLDRIDQRDKNLNGEYCYTRMGSNADIYIVDTGIQLNHNEFFNRVHQLFDIRCSIQIGTKIIYFYFNDTLEQIIERINNKFSYIVATNNENHLELNFHQPLKITIPNFGFDNILNVLGLKEGIITNIIGITENPTISLENFPYYSWDDNGHGTFVAGIAGGLLYGVAKGSHLISVKAFESTGNTYIEFLTEAMNSIIEHHKNKTNGRKSIVNFSYCTKRSTEINTLIETLIENGIFCCCSAGNYNTNSFDTSPSSAGCITQDNIDYSKKPIVVGSTTINDTCQDFDVRNGNMLSGTSRNNYGHIIDIMAPGVDIVSSWWSPTSTIEYASMSGTAASVAFVSGMCSLYLDGDYTQNELRERIISDSTKNCLSIMERSNAFDRTPNRLLFQPFNDVNFYWDYSNIDKGNIILSVDENSPIDVIVTAYSVDINNNKNDILYSIPPEKPIYGTKQKIPSMPFCYLECSTGRIVGQAPSVYKDGFIYSFPIRATDSIGNIIENQFKIKVNNANQKPYWVTPENYRWTFNEDDVVSVFVEAKDPDEYDTLTYSLLNGSLPPGLYIGEETGEIYGRINNVPSGDKLFEFTIRVTDGSQYIDRSFQIFVHEKNYAPEWAKDWLPPSELYDTFFARSFGTFNIGDYVDIKTMAYDSDNDPLTYSIGKINKAPPDDTISMDSLPLGLYIDKNTGRITGVISPRALTGRYFFTIDVDDGHIHIDNNNEIVKPSLTENFLIVVTDAVSTIQEIPLVKYDPFENPQPIIQIPGASRILNISAQVLSPFTGVNPTMSIGDKFDYSRLMKEKDSDLTKRDTYSVSPNYKYSFSDDMELYINFKDQSIPPQYAITLSNTSIDYVSIISPGIGYKSAPIPKFKGGGGINATATTTLKAVSIKLKDIGKNYSPGDIIKIVGGTPKTDNVNMSGTNVNIENVIKLKVKEITDAGGISTFEVLDYGIYYIAPNNPASTDKGVFVVNNGVPSWVGSKGSGATFNLEFGIRNIIITDKGIGYTSPPSIEFFGNGITDGSLRILIEYIPSDSTVFFGNIEWITKEGLLGDLYETYSSPYTVTALASGGFPVSYNLAPGSLPLPQGLSIDVSTGEIKGACSFIKRDTSYTFTIRASVGATFVDRTFTLNVKKLFVDHPVMGVDMILTGWDKRDWINYTKKYIPEDYVFRPDDKEYGIVLDPKMYILFGLPLVSEEKLWNVMTGNPERKHEFDFYRKTYLLLGDIKTAVARSSNGDILYEVIYRNIIDPLDKTYTRKGKEKLHIYAGGFNAGDSLVRNNVVYPQHNSISNKDNIYYLYPSSIMNMRKDLMAKDSGGIGLNGKEGLPLWMMSEQEYGNPNSIIGYTPAIVMAYLKPNTSKTVMRTIKLKMEGWDAFMGAKLIFDRFVAKTYKTSVTIFDENMLIPPVEQYTIVSSRDIEKDNAVKIYKDNDLINTPDHKGLYMYDKINDNYVINYKNTAKLIEERAEDHAIDRGLIIKPGNPPKDPPYLTPIWNSDEAEEYYELSDFLPHENPYGDRTVFDNDITTFDIVEYSSERFFKFPPSDNYQEKKKKLR